MTTVQATTYNLSLDSPITTLNGRGVRQATQPATAVIPQLDDIAQDRVAAIEAWANSLVTTLQTALGLDGEVATGSDGSDGSDVLPIRDQLGRIILDTDGHHIYDVEGVEWVSPVDVTINTDKLADTAVTTSKLADLAVDTAKLAALSVEASKLANAAVTETKIANLAVGTAAIQAAAVGTAQIANAAITTALIGDLQVVDAKIQDLDGGKIQANTITASQIASNTITSNEIAANTIVGGNILAGSVNANRLEANSITAAQIAAQAITSAEIQAFSITGNRIAAFTITGDRIAANTIQGSRLLAETITGDRLAVDSVESTRLATNSITAAKGHITDLAVQTLKLAGNAVTIPTAAYIGGENLVPNTSSWTSVVSVAFTSTGSPVNIWFSFRTRILGSTDVRLTRNGTTDVIAPTSIGSDFQGNHFWALTVRDVPGAGVVTYSLDVDPELTSSPGTYISNRSLVCIETKR